VLVSITALEFSYKQAPLRMKLHHGSLSPVDQSRDLINAGVNHQMVKRCT